MHTLIFQTRNHKLTILYKKLVFWYATIFIKSLSSLETNKLYTIKPDLYKEMPFIKMNRNINPRGI